MISVGDVPSNGIRPVDQLEQHDAERKQIGAMIDGLAQRLLRRHVGHRPHDHPRHRHLRLRRGRVAGAPERNFASPKSSTFTRPRSVRIRLALLMSRCTIPRACASSSASATCRPISTTSRTGSGALRRRATTAARRRRTPSR